MVNPVPVVSQPSMADGGCKLEDALSAFESSIGPIADDDGHGQGPWEGSWKEPLQDQGQQGCLAHWRLRSRLLTIRWCYVNTSMLTWLWTTLARLPFAMQDFGPMTKPWQILLLSLRIPIHPFLLKELRFVAHLLEQWRAFRGECGQADSAEFTQFWGGCSEH